ncbi:hypothetical protein ACFV6E_18075 [Streptomyces sp. NPDC059785]|uniref:hypothetical protein n=1 Tax=unclassified Streptomyces TaxID=2593676 RepID=UPI00364B1E33
MENTGTASASPVPAATARRSAAQWAGLAVLAIVVLLTGAFVYVFGPLLAISCGSCQDGVRDVGAGAGTVLLALARFGVPLTVLGAIGAMAHSRGGARAGAIGLGVLVALLIAMAALAAA